MRRLVILLCIAALVLAAVACGDPVTTPTGGSDKPSWDQAIEATAQYGAEQFNLQLTAIAEETPEP